MELYQPNGKTVMWQWEWSNLWSLNIIQMLFIFWMSLLYMAHLIKWIFFFFSNSKKVHFEVSIARKFLFFNFFLVYPFVWTDKELIKLIRWGVFLTEKDKLSIKWEKSVARNWNSENQKLRPSSLPSPSPDEGTNRKEVLHFADTVESG